MRRRYLIGAVPVLAALLGVLGGTASAGPDSALNALLTGEYALTQFRQCTNSSAGFNPETLQLNPLPTAGFVLFNHSTISDSARTRFNGDGTLTSTFRSVSNNFDVRPTGFPINVTEGTCQGTYQVDADGTVIVESTCSGPVTLGGSVGATVTATTKGRFQITQQGQILLLSSVNDPPFVATVTVTPIPPGTPVTWYRVCTLSGVSVKLSR